MGWYASYFLYFILSYIVRLFLNTFIEWFWGTYSFGHIFRHVIIQGCRLKILLGRGVGLYLGQYYRHLPYDQHWVKSWHCHIKKIGIDIICIDIVWISSTFGFDWMGNYGDFIGNISFRFIRIKPFSIIKNILYLYKSFFKVKNDFLQ